MGRWVGAVLLVALAGCVSEDAERVRDYTADGLHLYRQGDYLDARESFQAALALRPDDPVLIYNIAQCYDHQGADAQAERYYLACLQRSPDHAPCRHALAALLVHEGRGPEAVHMAEDWLTREPKKADPYALDGWLWHQKGDLPRAQGRLQQALELDTHNVQALTELARLYEEMHREDRAVVLYERILEIEPGNVEITARINRLHGTSRPQPE
jgi:Tfp pilus assembly protein PilF